MSNIEYVGDTLRTVWPDCVCPALKEPDEDFHRITQTDFEVTKECFSIRALSWMLELLRMFMHIVLRLV